MFKYTRFFTRNHIPNSLNNIYCLKTRSIHNINFNNDKIKNMFNFLTWMMMIPLSYIFFESVAQFIIYAHETFIFRTKDIKIKKKYMIDKMGMTKFYIADENDNIYGVKTSIVNWHKLETNEKIAIKYIYGLSQCDHKVFIAWDDKPLIARLLLKEYPTIVEINKNI